MGLSVKSAPFPSRRRVASSKAILRHSRGNLSASVEKSRSVILATTESATAETDADRRASGSTRAISPTWSPALRLATTRPLIVTENFPLNIRKRSLSAEPCVISTLAAGTALSVTRRASSTARSSSRTRVCVRSTSTRRSFPSGPRNRSSNSVSTIWYLRMACATARHSRNHGRSSGLISGAALPWCPIPSL